MRLSQFDFLKPARLGMSILRGVKALKVSLPGRFLPLSLLRACGKFLASGLIQVHVRSLGPDPEPFCGMGIVRDDVE
jgi:hypothetical protein